VNKRIILAAIMLISLAGLTFLLFILNRGAHVSPAFDLPEEEYIYAVSDVDSVTVRNNSGEYTMRSGNNPVIIGYENLPISTFYFIHILNVSSRLVSHGFITDEMADLSVFSLDPPQARVIIRQTSGKETDLHIGNDSPDGNVYVKLGGQNAVYLASSFDTAFFLNSLFDLVDTALIAPMQKDEDESIIFDRITLGGMVREEFTIINSGRSDNSMGLFINPLRIISPVNAAVSNDQIPLMETLFGLYADRFTAILSDNANTRREELSQYGLTAPWSTAEVIAANGRSRIQVSKPDNRGMVYIHREGTPLIYESAVSSLPWLETTWFELMNKMVLLPFIDTVAGIDIRTPQRTVTFYLSGSGNNLSVKTGTSDIETGNFRNFYQTLAAARYDEYSDTPYSALPPPFLEIIYHYRDSNKSADTLSFHEAASRRVFTSLNQGRPHFTFSAYTDQILSDLDLMLSGQRVRPYL